MMAITVTTLGTGSPIPDPNRAGPSTLIEAGGTRLLVDAGRGVVMRLTAAGVLPTMLDAVLLTHLHSDHISDLNDVVTTHWVMSRSPSALHIYGPRGTKHMIDGLLAMLSADISYRIAHHDDLVDGPHVEVHELDAPCELQIGAAQISVRHTSHQPVEPSIGYRIVNDGKTVAIAGDTLPCAGLDQLCDRADVYVQTVIRSDFVLMVPNPRFHDIIGYHSTMQQAAETASRNQVRTLVATHFVPPPSPDTRDGWLALATEHFAGEIVLADDLTKIEA
jgi:ribonuclease Z